jgi:hypothetical protein
LLENLSQKTADLLRNKRSARFSNDPKSKEQHKKDCFKIADLGARRTEQCLQLIKEISFFKVRLEHARGELGDLGMHLQNAQH